MLGIFFSLMKQRFSLFRESFFAAIPPPGGNVRQPLAGLDAISHLHEQVGGDLFLMNTLNPPPPPPRKPAADSEPYEGALGEIYVPAVPVHDLDTAWSPDVNPL
jgi:hypothetical protein